MLEDLVGLGHQIGASGPPQIVDGGAQGGETDVVALGDLREVGAGVERAAVGEAEHGHGPAAAPEHGLHRSHVDGADIGAFLPVDLDVDEQSVHQLTGLGILEGLVGHDMTPVAGRVADRDEHRHIASGRFLERLGAPAPPVDRVVAVLGEVGGQMGEVLVADAHRPSLAGVTVEGRHQRFRSAGAVLPWRHDCSLPRSA